MRTIKNAKIQSTFLGIEDHGIPVLSITFDYGGSGQKYGEFDLRYYGIEIIMKILKVLEADSWEELPNIIRVDADSNKIYRIGHIIKDRWFDIENLKNKF